MFAYGNYDPAVSLAATIVPVAVYFLILGILNTRPRPQLLTGRGDFSLLLVALSPLVVLPILSAVGVSVVSVVIIIAIVSIVIWVLSPPGKSWVVYNLSIAKTIEAVKIALDNMSLSYKCDKDGFILNPDDEQASSTIHISGFVLLRNVSIRIDGAQADLSERFQAELHNSLSTIHAESSPMAVALLLIATAMLVAPVTMFAHRGMPELVRLLTGLVQ